MIAARKRWATTLLLITAGAVGCSPGSESRPAAESMAKNKSSPALILKKGGAVGAHAPSSIQPIGQERTNWCWAAVSQMVLKHYLVRRRQCEIVSKRFSCGAANACCDRNDTANVYVKPELVANDSFQPLQPWQLAAHLESGSPVAFSRKVGDSTNHYYLIVDAFEMPASSGHLQLTVNDPTCSDALHCGDTHTVGYEYYNSGSHVRSIAGFTRSAP